MPSRMLAHRHTRTHKRAYTNAHAHTHTLRAPLVRLLISNRRPELYVVVGRGCKHQLRGPDTRTKTWGMRVHREQKEGMRVHAL